MSPPLECPVFHVTWEDIRGGFEAYIESVEDTIAKYGIAKLVPPPGWTPRAAGYADVEVEIPRPIRQNVTGGKGVFRSILVEEKPMSVQKEFRPMAEAKENMPKSSESVEDLEYQYWRNIRFKAPLYGADVEGSLFDKDLKGWNIRDLDTILTSKLRTSKVSIPGVVTPYLYFGMWKSTFAWHTEDMDLYSVNYLHFGEAKSWYTIQPQHRVRFENMVGSLPDTASLFRACPEFLRHKELIISPELLKLHNIPYVRVVQQPGDWIINYPGAYHSGFNHGFNCAESTNFATERWIEVGAEAGFCECRGDTVRIDMRVFGVEMESSSEEEEEEEVEEAPVKKKGPGRPRKTRPEQEVPVKRGPGRPKGSKTKPKMSPAAPAGASKKGPGRPRKHPLLTPPPVAPPGKAGERGRGRPRTNPLPAVVPAVAQGGPLKRGRGRQREDSLKVRLQAARAAPVPPAGGVVKRGRGRPRKYPLPEVLTPAASPSPTTASSGKHKRRRPRKHSPLETESSSLPVGVASVPLANADQSGEVGKRKRGRPRKNPLEDSGQAGTMTAQQPAGQLITSPTALEQQSLLLQQQYPQLVLVKDLPEGFKRPRGRPRKDGTLTGTPRVAPEVLAARLAQYLAAPATAPQEGAVAAWEAQPEPQAQPQPTTDQLSSAILPEAAPAAPEVVPAGPSPVKAPETHGGLLDGKQCLETAGAVKVLPPSAPGKRQRMRTLKAIEADEAEVELKKASIGIEHHRSRRQAAAAVVPTKPSTWSPPAEHLSTADSLLPDTSTRTDQQHQPPATKEDAGPLMMQQSGHYPGSPSSASLSTPLEILDLQ